MRYGLGALAGVAALTLAAAAAQAQTPPAEAGRELAQSVCSNCHVVEADPAKGSDQAPSFRSIAARPATTDETLHAFLLHPHGNMPPLTLSNEQIADLSAYILSLRP
jgi:mono/diheme cytochrome c family protein